MVQLKVNGAGPFSLILILFEYRKTIYYASIYGW